LWNYHLLNHLGFSYTLLNAISVMYTVILLCTNSIWQRVLRRYSWIKTFGIAILIFVPTEFIMFSLTADMAGVAAVFVATCFVQNLMSVGINFSYSNILYMNLPEENSTAHVAFNTIGCNLFAFFGMMTGTYVSSLTGDNTIRFLWMDAYSVQFTTLLRAVFLAALGLVLILNWKHFTRDADIADIEEQNEMRKRIHAMKKRMPSKWQMLLYRLRSRR